MIQFQEKESVLFPVLFLHLGFSVNDNNTHS